MKSASSTLDVLPNEIHVWYAFPDEIRQTSLLSDYQQLLNPAETQQWQRFHFDKHRHLYLIARALVRTTLSRYTAITPSRLQFTKNAYGKPELIHSDRTPQLCFNLSHTDGLVVLGIVSNQKIGVDVENMERQITTAVEDIARYFSPQEVSDFSQIPAHQRHDRFFDYWTLKESYIKACGMGLSLPLDQFTFHIQEKESLRISFAASLNDDPNNWQFWLFDPTPSHKAAISLHRHPGTEYCLVMKKAVPLVSEQDFSCTILNTS